ncbi:hypothetical protein [Asticcacaulis sp.]|uniref:hypothetical protein n=1 Tax=Asticcacaulis sp. TaxID=1872648 RepID=UPI002C9F6428|nr:hypothetical protein [Asticcacaulis sp.]HTM79843.1 hypothetical protein [Asticcacaulis sp.]
MSDFDFKTAADVARAAGPSDPFPPEGTDEKIISSVKTGEDAISEDDSLRATKAALASASGGGKGVAPMEIVTTFVSAFLTGFFRTTPHQTQLRHDKKLRDNLDEDQIDSMIDDSFPASDPPSSY